MNIHGINQSLVVIGDTDGLIAILHEEDKNHQKAKDTIVKLLQNDAQTIFPLTTIVETVTTLKRKLNKPALAAHVIKQITSGTLAIENTDTDLLSNALKIFDPAGSKKNTLFDAIVAALAQKKETKIIFSFDEWYRKLGFQLASDLA